MCSPNKNLHTKPWSVLLFNFWISIWNDCDKLTVLCCEIVLSAVDLLSMYQTRTFPWQLTPFSFLNVCMSMTQKLSRLFEFHCPHLSQYDDRCREGWGTIQEKAEKKLPPTKKLLHTAALPYVPLESENIVQGPCWAIQSTDSYFAWILWTDLVQF